MRQVAARDKMQFEDLRLGVIFMIIWLVKWSGAIPTVTLNPVSSVYFDVGGSMSLACEVDQDIGVTRIYFSRNNSVQVSISPSTCTTYPSIIGDPHTYSSTCSQGRFFTLKINGVSVDDHRNNWFCKVLTSSGTCASNSGVNCASPDISVIQRVAVTSLQLTDISGQSLSSPVSVRVGSKTYFKCSTSPNGSRPKATFHWYNKTGSQAPVEIEDQTIISSTPDPIPVPGQPETDLVISYSMFTLVGNKQDQNVYILCGGRDETNTGDGKLSGMAQLNIVYPPVVSLLPNYSVFNVTEDRQNFVLTCNVVDANPQPQQNGFQWLHKSVLVPGQTSSSYKIQSVQKSHDGEYKCTASNLHGNGTSEPLYLVVQYGPSITQLGIKDVEEGDNLSVTCIVSASPPAIVMWTRSGKQISQSPVLSLPSISRNQEGNYICTANNVLYPTGLSPEFKQATETLGVQVFYGPGNSTSLNRNKLLYEVEEGQTAETINCTAACKPACSYIWFKDNTKMYNISTLSLGTVQKNSTGNYTCKAYNTVLGQLRNSTVVMHVRIKFAPIVKIQANPEGSNPYIVKIGQMKILLTCVVIDAYPHPTSFIWTHNGSEIRNNGESVYNITEVIRQSSGTWGCRGVNSIGTPEQSTFEIDVQYGPIISPIANRTAVEGRSLNVTCVVDANPAPYLVSWTKDNNFQQTSIDLQIDNLTRYDNGTYKCTAYNKIHPTGLNEEVLNAMEEFYLDVHYGPRITQLGIKDVEEGDNLSVTCIVSASPPAIVMWTRSGEQISQSAVLSLPLISLNQEGNYTCTASNVLYPTGLSPDFKQTSETLNVHVLSAPKILNISPDYKGYVGQFTIVQFNFYSNKKENLTVTARHSNSSGLILQGIIQPIHLDNRQVNMSQIPVPVFRAALVISITSDIDFGQYDIEVTNSIGSDSKSIRIVEQTTPEKPINFHATNVQEKQLSLTWQSGYNGGFTQTFVVEISLENITWNNVSEVSAGNRDGWFSTAIGDLIPGSEYYFRLYAYNINRRGDFANVQLEVRTLKECAYTSSHEVDVSAGKGIGASVGIGVGGTVLGLIGAITAFSIRRRLIGPKSSCFRSKGKTDGEMHTYSNDAMNPETVKSVYEELNKGNAEQNVYDKVSPF